MEISRITNVGMNKTNRHRRLDILRWMQKTSIENPKFLKNTTAKNLAQAYCQQSDGVSCQTVQMLMTDMIKKHAIIKHKTGGQRATFRINYLYPNLPKEFVRNANEEDKGYVERTMSIIKEKEEKGLKPKLTDDCTVVTKPEEKAVATSEEMKEEIPKDPEQVQTSVPITVEKDGQNFSITINLNINLGR